jgi:hypothetical protein
LHEEARTVCIAFSGAHFLKIDCILGGGVIEEPLEKDLKGSGWHA